MALPTGLSDECLAFASLSTRSAEPGIQKGGPLASAGCSNIFLFLACRRRRPPCNRPARLPKRLCGLRESRLPPLSQPWVRSGHGARAFHGANCFFWLRCSGRPERWRVTGRAAPEIIPRLGARSAIHEWIRGRTGDHFWPTSRSDLLCRSSGFCGYGPVFGIGLGGSRP